MNKQRMISVWQRKDFWTGRRMNKAKCLGYFFSLESAKKKLGWFFVHDCCRIESF